MITPITLVAYGAKGLAYIKVNEVADAGRDGLQSPILKFLPDAMPLPAFSSVPGPGPAISCSLVLTRRVSSTMLLARCA